MWPVCVLRMTRFDGYTNHWVHYTIGSEAKCLVSTLLTESSYLSRCKKEFSNSINTDVKMSRSPLRTSAISAVTIVDSRYASLPNANKRKEHKMSDIGEESDAFFLSKPS